MGKLGAKVSVGTAIGLVLLMALPAGWAAAAPVGFAHAPPHAAPVVPALGAIVARYAPLPRTAVPDTEPGLSVPGAVELGPSSASSVLIVLTLPFSNGSSLAERLAAISDRASPEYHHYLSAAAFDAAYGGSPAAYASLVAYLSAFGPASVTTYATRTSVTLQAPASVVDRIFATELDTYRVDGRTYYAPSTPATLPAPLAASLVGVEGLTSYSQFLLHANLQPLTHRAPPVHRVSPPGVPGYLAPATRGGVQYEYAPDLQVAYDEQSLFDQRGYPTDAVVATLLWDGVYSGANTTTPYGSLTNGQQVGGFDPRDVSDFFNQTIPSFEPHATVTGVPLAGAAAPGPLASYATNGANVENTLDLEMVGSTAPGAKLYTLYGPNNTYAGMDSAFAFALSPNASLSALANVSVISNSWGGLEWNDPSWNSSLATAQARGITVLASSGDSGNDNASPKWTGGAGTDAIEFPSAMAFDTYGVVAVGGTTLTLSTSTLQLATELAWYDNGSQVSGSTGGISSVFAEPSWQTGSSLANGVIGGAGRGVPDIAAIANNTLLTLTLDNYEYLAKNATLGGSFEAVGGTSIAAPIEAGIVAEIDHVMRSAANPWVGFLDPALYPLANAEDTSVYTLGNFTVGFIPTGSYSSPLPTLALNDTVGGGNYRYTAGVGYDLVTGWGSIDAYNYTMYFLNVSPGAIPGALDGVDGALTIAGLNVTSPYVAYNASIQQNFFLANALGAPVYWVQNVLYIQFNGTGWGAYYSGWIIFPFYGQYPYLADYEYNFPGTWTGWSFPQLLNVSTNLSVPSGPESATVTFSVGSYALSLPAPGASYILGNLWYNYSWQGATYENGPYAPNPSPGGLAPQFAFVGGPSGGTGTFGKPTAGALTTYLRPYGTGSWVAPGTMTYGYPITQTGESASGLAWNRSGTGTNTWSMGVLPGSNLQGVVSYVPVTVPHLFNETGLPGGSGWYVNVTNASGVVFTGSGRSSSIALDLQNGSYNFTATTSQPGYNPVRGPLTVSGAPGTTLVRFAPVGPTVTFNESGIPAAALAGGARWYVNVTGNVSTDDLRCATVSCTTVNLPQGNYTFTAQSGDSVWSAVTNGSGAFALGASPLYVDVAFHQVTYQLAFNETGLPLGSPWYVNGTNGTGGSFSLRSTGTQALLATSNGTVNYTIQSADPHYAPTVPTGSAAIRGADSVVDVAFSAEVYVVTFTQSSLPAGTEWFVNVTGEPSANSTAGSVTLSLLNGSYRFTTGHTDARWYASNASTPFSVAGRPLTVNVSFRPVTYTVSLGESGLPAGVEWYVNLTGPLGSVPGSSTGASFTLELQNGSYPLRIASADKRWAPGAVAGPIVVAGANATFTDTFSLVTYAVTFTEVGLPSGSAWSVNATGPLGPFRGSSVLAGLVLEVPNGSYQFRLATTAAGYIGSPPTGGFAVAGLPVNRTVGFTPFTYAVNVTATGLPATTSWWVNLTNGDTFGFSGPGGTVSLPNGSFVYRVASADHRYAPMNGTGPLDVAGAPVNLTIAFRTVTYSVSFLESGLPASEQWSVTLNAAPVVGTTQLLTFSGLTNGTYQFTVGAVAGYTIAPASGNVTVAGADQQVRVTFAPVAPGTTTPTSPGASGIAPYWWIAIALAVAIALLGAVLFLRRRREPESKPAAPAKRTPASPRKKEP